MARDTTAARVGQKYGKRAFKTLNYKHEVTLNEASPRFVGNYTQEMWETLCAGVAEMGFNGLVFYSAYHPFEHVLDYREFPQAANQPEKHRNSVRAALRLGLTTAHRHGLTTFMQHYVGHFTEAIAHAAGVQTVDRTCGVDHPEIERYIRYCYREIFKQLPDLDGLYFNFESAGPAAEHVMRTAIPEMNAMKRPPVALFRLWGFTDAKGMRRLVDAYKGRTLVCHKISDSNDVYYLPVADSRVWEWKRALGKKVEFLYEMGPCHNCGTNLCDQLWGDYDFVHELISDAAAKGADGIGFHTVNEFLSPVMDPDGKVFSAHERAMARYNWLHLQAVVDFCNGKKRNVQEQVKSLAEHVGVRQGAGRYLWEAIVRSSQLVLLSYQQFAYGSDWDGYLNRGRWSHIQEPFYFYPATDFNDQVTSPLWSAGRTVSWLNKQRDTKTVRPALLQSILDYANPKKAKAKRNPHAICILLRKHMKRARWATERYRRTAGQAAADELMPYIRQNEVLGRMLEREIEAAITLYNGYFPRSQKGMRYLLQQGLAQLQRVDALRQELTPREAKVLQRVLMMDRTPDVTPEIAAIRKALENMAGNPYPFEAQRLYMESHRLYNEIRRTVLPYRTYDMKMIREQTSTLPKAIDAAKRSMALLRNARRADLAENVEGWLQFLQSESDRIAIPSARCADEASAVYQPLQHNHCFLRGESFGDDFVSFFEAVDFERIADLSFATWHTDKELVVSLRESGAAAATRPARWDALKDDMGSLSFVMQVHLDMAGKGRDCQTVVVWPKSGLANIGHKATTQLDCAFRNDGNGWRMTARIPFNQLGVPRPAKGDVWGMNVTSNPSIAKHSEYTWAPQYDCRNPRLFGKVRFG